MADIQRFGISIPTDLLRKFDRVLVKKGYQNRSEAVRDMMRDYLAAEQAAGETGQVLATVALVYDHDVTGLTDRMIEQQHRYHQLVVSSMHVHLTRSLCMEVIALQGEFGKVKLLADHLISLKGVQHGKFFFAPAAKHHAHS